MTGFWRGWMLAWCASVALFGVVLSLGAFPATDGLVLMLLTELGGEPVAMTPALRFCLAVLGPVTLGWAVSAVTAVLAAERLGREARPIWLGLTLAALAWFVPDSIGSVATGFGANLLPNTLFLLAFVVPVLATGVLRRNQG